MVENLFNDRIECNALRVKDGSVKALEKQATKAKKAKAYAESIRNAVVTTKELAEVYLALAKAKKKKIEESLAHVRMLYAKLEASSKQIKKASQINFDNSKKFMNVSGHRDNCFSKFS